MRTTIRLTAIVVMVAMLVSPLALAGPLSDAATDEGEVELVQNSDGTYELRFDYLERIFNTDASPSVIRDPVGSGAVGITPMEIAAPDEDSSTMTYIEYGNDTPVAVDEYATMIYNQMVRTAADMFGDGIDGYIGIRPIQDVVFVSYVPFDSPDWVEDYIVPIEPLQDTYLDDLESIPNYQSINITPYVVADFDGDSRDEVAIIFAGHLAYMYCDDRQRMDSKLVYLDDEMGTDILVPSHVTAADMDLDGDLEIVILRSHFDGEQGVDEHTRMTIVDPDDMGVVTHDIIVEDPRTGGELDAVMVSGTQADVDNDGVPELVIGGYLWDNDNTDTSYTKKWDNSAGELFLSYMELGDPAGFELRGVTVLGDDEGTATTRYNHDADYFEDNYDLNSHNDSDTSIYTTDSGGGHHALTRSVNWSNWTIPMTAGSFTGMENGRTSDQVFFDWGLYRLESMNGQSWFEHMGMLPKLTRIMDDNNVVCNDLTVGSFYSQDSTGYNGKEDLFIGLTEDLQQKSHDGSNCVLGLLYRLDGVSGDYSIDDDEVFCQYRGWSDDNNICFAGNFDHDTYFVKLNAHMFTFTDPKVISVLSAVPYEQDLADVLMLGADNIGFTGYKDYTATEATSEFELGFEVHANAEFNELLGWMRIDVQGGYQMDHRWTDTDTVTVSSEYYSSNDSIAMYITPVDIYFYDVLIPSEGGYTRTIQALPFFGETVTTILEENAYRGFVDEYNRQMGGYLGDDFVPLEKVDLTGCTQGDITSYVYEPVDPIVEPMQIYYDQDGNYSYIKTTVDMSHSTSESHSDGFNINMDITVGKWKHTFSGGAEMDFDWTSSTANITGMAFSVELAQGNQNNYLGVMSESSDVLGQYSMFGTMWAEERQQMYNVDGEDRINEYVLVGFTVTRHTEAPKLGKVVPNIYVPDGTDESDPYNPTSDSICLEVWIPGTLTEDTACGDEYILQMMYQGQWYDLPDGLRLYTLEETDGTGWTASDGRFEPSEEPSSVMVRVSGLSGVTDSEFRFRIEAVSETGYNPSLGVTGYKDNRVGGVSGIHLVDMSHSSGEDEDPLLVELGWLAPGTVVMVKTSHQAGDRVDLHLVSDGELMERLLNLPVYEDGYLVFEMVDHRTVDDCVADYALIAMTVIAVVGLSALVFRRD